MSGSTYGLLDELTLAPRPDYSAALLWRRIVGTRVLRVPPLDLPPEVRVYAHCLRDGPPGAVALLALNPNGEASADLRPADLGLRGPVDLYVGSADGIASPAVRLNGTVLATAADGTPPACAPSRHRGDSVAVQPAAWTFLVAREARMSACSP